MSQILKGLNANEFSCAEVMQACIGALQHGKSFNAFTFLKSEEELTTLARQADENRAKGKGMKEL